MTGITPEIARERLAKEPKPILAREIGEDGRVYMIMENGAKKFSPVETMKSKITELENRVTLINEVNNNNVQKILELEKERDEWKKSFEERGRTIDRFKTSLAEAHQSIRQRLIEKNSLVNELTDVKKTLGFSNTFIKGFAGLSGLLVLLLAYLLIFDHIHW